MPRSTTFKAAMAATLGLSLIAGCAAPSAVTTPAGGTPPAMQPDAPAASASPSAEAPTQPAPAAVTPMTLAGTATFRGEALAGYAVSVLDARTGKPVATTSDPASASGLAVLNQGLTTDAQGAFTLQVVGLSAGQALLVQVNRGSATLEAVVGSNMQAFGAAGYRVRAVGGTIAIDERSTALAKIAAGVLRATSLLGPEAAAGVIAKLATRLAALAAQLDAPLKATPGVANGLVSAKAAEAASAVKSLVTNAGATQSLTESVAALVAEIAKAAPQGAPSDEVKAALARVEFVGTVLTGGLGDGGLTLTNSLSGAVVTAATGDLTKVSAQPTRSSSRSGSTPSFGPPPALPAIPEGEGTVVDSLAGLKAALESGATHVTLGGDIVTEYLGDGLHTITPTAPFVLHGAGHRIYGEWSVDLVCASGTFENLEVGTTIKIQNSAAGDGIRFDHVTFDSFTADGIGSVEYTGPSPVMVTFCQFQDTLRLGFYLDCLYIYREETTPVLIYRSNFTSRPISPGGSDTTHAISLYDPRQVTIRENTFTNFEVPVSLDVADDDQVPDFSETAITGNRFDSPLWSAIDLGFGFDAQYNPQTPEHGALLRRITGNTFIKGQYPLTYRALDTSLADDEAYFTQHNTMDRVQFPRPNNFLE